MIFKTHQEVGSGKSGAAHGLLLPQVLYRRSGQMPHEQRNASEEHVHLTTFLFAHSRLRSGERQPAHGARGGHAM